MLDKLLKAEEQLARLEALLLIIFVLTMLTLATYNVFYRNVLVPIQVKLLTPDEVAVSAPASPPQGEAEPPEAAPSEPEEGAEDSDGFGGGFGGGFGDEPAEPEAEPAQDPSGGFGGGFGDEPAQESPPQEPEKPASDPSDGFGGGFDSGDSDEPAEDPSEGFGGGFGGDESGDDGGFGGGFDESASDSADAAPQADSEPTVPAGPPPEPHWFAELVDTLKLEWIDVVLRQLVLIVGFFGAMLATRRRKHITIDALSKVIPQKPMRWITVFTNSLSTAMCFVLAIAGWDLVKISLEYPKELVSFADEWHFQMAFPLGFGLLGLHFLIRVVESVFYAAGWAEPPDDYETAGGIA